MITRRELLGLGIRSAALGYLGAAGQAHASAFRSGPGWRAEAEAVARGVRLPVIPAVERSVEAGAQDARGTIQAAIDALNADGGGRVIVPAGEWLIKGPLHLKSNIELHLERGATLLFSGNPADYLPAVLTRWEGTEMFGYSPFIYAWQASNVAITGAGVINGQGGAAFAAWRATQGEAQRMLREMGAKGTPLYAREFAEGRMLRPSLIQFFGCQNVLVEGIRLEDMPFWGVHLVYSRDCTVRELEIESVRGNNDGVDVDSSGDILIERCRFMTGDDSVVVKSGRDLDGRRVGRPSERVVVRRCEISSSKSAGVAIGSEMSGGVRDVFVLECTMGEVETALNIKSNLDRGGEVERIRVYDLEVGRARRVIQVTTSYHGYRGSANPPRLHDFELEKIRCAEADYGIVIKGAAESPVADLGIRDLDITRVKTPRELAHVTELRGEGVQMNGERVQLPSACGASCA